MASGLTAEEMSHLTGVLQKPEVLANSAQALQDYIRVVNDEYAKRTRQAGLDPLLAAQEKYKEKKGRKA